MILIIIESYTTWWFGLVWFMVFNATFNNISVISWRSFIVGGWNRSTRRRSPSCHKSL